MYRGTLLGLALTATLAEMNPRLTPRQEEEVWRVFDASMDGAAAQAPLVSAVSVHVPPPSAVAGGGTTVVSAATTAVHIPAEALSSTTPTETEGTAAAPVEAPQQQSLSSSTEAFDDSMIAFPVTRHTDGMWTMLLKDPTVVIRDKMGNSEKMQLDYLKVCLKDVNGAGDA